MNKISFMLKRQRVKNIMGKIVIDENLCKGCTLCINACPLHLIRTAQRINAKGYYSAEFADKEGRCTGCTLCAITCPDVAIEVYREKKTEAKK